MKTIIANRTAVSAWLEWEFGADKAAMWLPDCGQSIDLSTIRAARHFMREYKTGRVTVRRLREFVSRIEQAAAIKTGKPAVFARIVERGEG